MIGKRCNMKDLCVHGNLSQPLSNFPRAPHRPDGKADRCLDCVREVSKIKEQRRKENMAEFKKYFI